ncbi:MAG TPA: alpha/beta hydrolase [Bryobacteraceae bacterium]|nr:alpha/beta hydrolase [Bryobacteraceae bacterium]
MKLASVRPAIASGVAIAAVLSIVASAGLAQEQASTVYPPAMAGASEVAVYKTIGDTQLRLYIFQPAGNRAGNRTPAIVFYFGGGWVNGSPEQFHRQCVYFSSRGMVAIAVDYRVRSRNNTTPLDAVRDAKSSLRWVRENAARLGIDPSRIAAAGGSAGGHLAAAAGIIDGLDEANEDLSVSSRPNALVLYNPVVITALVAGTNLKGFGTDRGPIEEMEAISPYHHIARGDPPTIVFHGRADTTVPFASAEAFRAKMVEMGNRCELVGFDGAGHGFFNTPKFYSDVAAQTDDFLVSIGYLKGKAESAHDR